MILQVRVVVYDFRANPERRREKVDDNEEEKKKKKRSHNGTSRDNLSLAQTTSCIESVMKSPRIIILRGFPQSSIEVTDTYLAA